MKQSLARGAGNAHGAFGPLLVLMVGLTGCPATSPSKTLAPSAPITDASDAPPSASGPEAPFDNAEPQVSATALARVGATVYIAEGCYTCHGSPAPWLSIPPAPFPWGGSPMMPLGDGARARGPAWHYEHLINPRAHVPHSIMPSYAHLADEPADGAMLESGSEPRNPTPTRLTDDELVTAYETEARALAAELAKAGIDARWDSQLVALVGLVQGGPALENPRPSGF